MILKPACSRAAWQKQVRVATRWDKRGLYGTQLHTILGFRGLGVGGHEAPDVVVFDAFGSLHELGRSIDSPISYEMFLETNFKGQHA